MAGAFSLTSKAEFKSDAFEAIYRAAQGLHRVGTIDSSVAKSTHAGTPWQLNLCSQLCSGLHFWPFYGWSIASGKSALVEVYPALCKHAYPVNGRMPSQHNAFAVASWLSQADRSCQLVRFLQPALSPPERIVAGVEGWILGVGQSTLAAGAAHPVSSR